MIRKEDCIIGTKVVINNKSSKWNDDLGSINNGLMCFLNADGYELSDQMFELLPNVELTILSKPKRTVGTVITFKTNLDGKVYSTWWCCFKPKVDLSL